MGVGGEVRFTVPRDPRGRFAKFSTEVTALMDKEAKQFQVQVATDIDSHILRRPASTGRLVAVTQQPGNRQVGRSVWRVGIPSYLNKSTAKYWRTIEQGSLAVWKKPFTGTVLYGLWLGDKAYRQSIFLPYSRKARLEAIKLGDLKNRYTVSKEIEPMGSYARVYREGNWGERTQREIRQILGRNFGK